MKNFFEILFHLVIGLLIIICMIIGFLIMLPFLICVSIIIAIIGFIGCSIELFSKK
jgi:ABC-type enterochelin transport system permease subunit